MEVEKPIARIRQIIKDKNLSVSAFEKKIGMSNNSIQVALKRNANVKDETLNHILAAFPEISAEWLLTGKGTMIRNAYPPAPETSPTVEEERYVIQLQREYIAQLKKEIEELKSQLEK
ncbi:MULTISPECIES: helix-turn-helix transcriptional regulator [unclassified Flavobacterium]|uniref:helix-turn-helix domain-containing protein n=1 Tax=unclassified Flavobacterium TaxID=196869 RepID=UPI001F14103E|nr:MULTISPECIES: helix-turn-helix transcriptional regulator [unclassified Flavobacterium]UMY66763.1 helix-turn-helix domain-containing protein [Flavobacterium sp. HJ-32-4]